MKISLFACSAALVAASAASLFAQEAAPESAAPADETAAVVRLNGQEFSAEKLDQLRRNLPEVFKQQTARMNNKSFVETLAYLLKLNELAKEKQLSEAEPWKTQLWFNELNFLANAYLATINSSLEITDADVEEYLEANRSQYEEARVSAIYFEYSPIPELAEKEGKDVTTEREAWEQAEKLLVELRNGADFAELAKEHSDDAASAEKGGDMGYFSPTDNTLSPAVKEAIFALDEGQISAPVKDGGRYYIFKVTERRALPADQIKAQVLQKVQTAMLQQRLDEIRKSVEVEIIDPSWAQ